MSRFSVMSNRRWHHIYRFYACHASPQMPFMGAIWILYLLELPIGPYADLVGRRWSFSRSIRKQQTSRMSLSGCFNRQPPEQRRRRHDPEVFL